MRTARGHFGSSAGSLTQKVLQKMTPLLVAMAAEQMLRSEIAEHREASGDANLTVCMKPTLRRGVHIGPA